MLLYENVRSAGREIQGIYYSLDGLYVIIKHSQPEAKNKEWRVEFCSLNKS